MYGFSYIGVLKIQAVKCPEESDKNLKETILVLQQKNRGSAANHHRPLPTIGSWKIIWVPVTIQGLRKRLHDAIHVPLWSYPSIARSFCYLSIHKTGLQMASYSELYTVKAWEHQSPTVQWTLDPSENQTVSTVDPEPRAAKLRWKWNEAIPLKMTLVYSIFYDDPVMFKTCNNSCILVIWGGIFWLRCFRRHKSLVSVQTGSHFKNFPYLVLIRILVIHRWDSLKILSPDKLAIVKESRSLLY